MTDFPGALTVNLRLASAEGDPLDFNVRQEQGTPGSPPRDGPPPVLVRIPGTGGFYTAYANKKGKITPGSEF